MKFCLLSSSEELIETISTIFRDEGRDIDVFFHQDALANSLGSFYHAVVLIDIKLKGKPGFSVSKELKELYPDRNLKTILLLPSVEKGSEEKMMELWRADGVLSAQDFKNEIRLLLRKYPAVIRGNLKSKPFLRLLLEINSKRFTGTLTLIRSGMEKAIFFKDGVPRYAITSKEEERIGEYLKSIGRISDEELSLALTDAAAKRKRLGEILVERGFLKEPDIKQFVKKQMEEIFASIFAWDEADYNIGSESIAHGEDILIEKPLEHLIYHGVKKYLNPAIIESSLQDTSLCPRLLLSYEDISKHFPFNENESELIRRFTGTHSMDRLSFYSNLSLAEILRIVYLLNEMNYIELAEAPPESALSQSEEYKTLKSEEPAGEEEEITTGGQPALTLEGDKSIAEPEAEFKGREIKELPLSPSFLSKLPSFSGFLTGMLSGLIIAALAAGIIFQVRAKNTIAGQLFITGWSLLATDSIPALKRAIETFNKYVDIKGETVEVLSALSFAKLRLFEGTNDRNILKESKDTVDRALKTGKVSDEMKAVAALVYSASGDYDASRKIIDESNGKSIFEKFARARFMLEYGGDPGGASQILSEAISEEGKMVAFKIEFLKACLFAGCISSSNHVLEELEASVPGHSELMKIKGEIFLLNGKYEEAENMFRYSLMVRPRHSDTLLSLAKTHLEMKKYREAMEELERVMLDSGIDTTTGMRSRFYYAKALSDTKQIEMAKALLEELKSRYPGNNEISDELESVKEKLERLQEVKKEPSITELLKRGKDLYEKGRFKDAEKIFRSSIDTANDEILYYYGLTLYSLGRSTEAFLQFKKAESMNPGNPLVHKELGKLYKERGNEEASREHFKLYLQYLKK